MCSWSVQPATPRELAARCNTAGVTRVQLHLDPIRIADRDPDNPWNLVDTVRTLARAGIAICSGMMSMEGEDYSTLESIRRTGGLLPDQHWELNRAAAIGNARIARQLGLSLVTFHAGFIPEDPRDPRRTTLLDRVRQVAEIFAVQNVAVGLETGQETADSLLEVLDLLNRRAQGYHVGVNFDPANMILYGMGDPVDALRRLAPHVVQVHLKDAVPTTSRGTWGRETVIGQGAVDWNGFFEVVRDFQHSLDLVIERESGATRTEDIAAGRLFVAPMVAAINIGTPLPPHAR